MVHGTRVLIFVRQIAAPFRVQGLLPSNYGMCRVQGLGPAAFKCFLLLRASRQLTNRTYRMPAAAAAVDWPPPQALLVLLPPLVPLLPPLVPLLPRPLEQPQL